MTVKNVFHCYSLRFARVLSRFSHVWLFVIPWTAARQTPLFFTISRSLLIFMSIDLVMVSNHLILCCPLLFLPSKRTVCVLSRFSHVWLFATAWTVAWQALLSMGFSRQEYWSGLPCPSPGDLPDPGIKPTSLVFSALQEDSLPLSHQRSPHKRLSNSKSQC